MNPVEVIRGDGPIILGQPHIGTWLPDDVRETLNERGLALADTDWWIDRLYDGLLPNATIVRNNVHRYVVDANRNPNGESMYPGQNTTTLIPLTDFDGDPIWRTPPNEVMSYYRAAAFHSPYHMAMAAEVDRVRAAHGVAILYDCHSIRSEIPYLFDGVLPIFNIGDAWGGSCAPEVRAAVEAPCKSSGLEMVVNGRFKGGWTTRHYGDPAAGVHAIQMELAQRAYMTEAAPWDYLEDRAAEVRPILAEILKNLVTLAPFLKD